MSLLASARGRYAALSKPMRAALWLTACNFVVRGISFLVAPVMTRLLPPSEYGQLSLLDSYASIALIIATWEIQQGAYTRGLFKFAKYERAFTTATQLLVNLLTAATFVVALAFSNPLESITGIPRPILPVMWVYLTVYPAYTMWMTRKRVAYDYRPVCAATLGYATMNIVVPIVAVMLLDRSAEVKYASGALAVTILCLPLWVRNARYVGAVRSQDTTKRYWSFLVSYEAPLILHSLSYLMLNQADRVMIGRMVGVEEAALYSLAYTLSLAVSVLQSSVEQVLGPWRYEMMERGDYASLSKVSTLALAAFGLVSLAYMLVAPELLAVFPERYGEAVWCIPPVAASVFFTFLYSTFVGVESYLEKTGYVMRVSVVCSLLNVALNWLLIPTFGYLVCAWTTLVCYVAFSVGHYAFMRRALREAGIGERVVDSRSMAAVALAFLLLTAVALVLYGSASLRRLAAVALVVVAIAKRRGARSLVERVRNP